ESTGDKFLKLIANPFSQETRNDAILASLIFSLSFAVLLALLFCVLRPTNTVVYAPRAKHADSKHAPPPISKGLFGWIPVLIKTKEPDMVERAGLDAALFMRFTRMCRNIFLILSVIGCGIIIPTNIVTSRTNGNGQDWFSRLTPQFISYGTPGLWAYVVFAWVADIVVCFFLWRNYRAVTQLRRQYLDSTEYQKSLHARTLLITDMPRDMRTDEGVVNITQSIKGAAHVPRGAVARNVKDLPELVEEHEETVRALESHLAKYLKNPDQLPAKRPMCKVSKSDKAYSKGQKVDAIEYLTARIRELELEIREVRQSVDKRNALPYGFASYESIIDAHSTAYTARKKGPNGTIVRLAPKPIDLVWKNLPLMKRQRTRNNLLNNIWVVVLTALWIVPNILIAVFLSNLNNVAALWPAFKDVYNNQDNKWWIVIVQGVLAPGLTSLFYYYLPAVFRRLCINAGDVTKTSRERHVMHKLYTFFIINNLILFSLFGAFFTYIAAIVGASKDGKNIADAIFDSKELAYAMSSFTTVGPYWLAWILQRNLGAAIDLSQLVRLAWGSFSRKFGSPTPREMIELTAPQPFEYASYYNYFLFYATVAMCYAVVQPLVLPVTAFYFYMDSFLKKYLLLYVFITKYESGGMFWRVVFNRFLFLTLLGNIVVALYVLAFGGQYGAMLGCMAPLPFLLIGFKLYCKYTFDDQIHFYETGKALKSDAVEQDLKSRKGDRVATRFGHPALYKPLTTPMVAAKSQHMLKQVYSGRLDQDDDAATVTGFSDVYMDTMDSAKPGKSTKINNSPFEFVAESDLDFEHFKNRPEFRDEAGGDGELYGRAADIIRPGTPSSMMTGVTRTGTMESDFSGHRKNYHDRSASGSNSHSRSESRDSSMTHVPNADVGVEYPRGYHQTPSALREHSPAPSDREGLMGRSESPYRGVRSGSPYGAQGRSGSPYGGAPAPTPGGYAPVTTPGSTPGEDTSYDYFRRGR
ncbi:DUF221-domain-containing protein, partial [Polychaeton citri CBS 116435]